MKRLARVVVALFGAMAAMTASLEVRAETLPAIAGAPFLQSEAICFTKNSFSNRVTNTGCGTFARTWLIPMVVVSSAMFEVHASSAGSGTSPTCRAVMRAHNDSSGTLGNPFPIGNDTFLGNFNTNSSMTGHVDCLLTQNGRGVGSVRWVRN